MSSTSLIGTDEIMTSTNHFREELRHYCKVKRELRRNNESDSLRLGLEEIRLIIKELENLTEKDVMGLCSRIKRRKHATKEDMLQLSHAFLQDLNNIITFAKVQGAINIIVKELTGRDSEQQIKASETLCNLSLGDKVVCEKIANFAGSYLVTYFYSTENRLKKTSLWTIMNIAATGGKGLSILISQAIITKFVSLYCNEKDSETLKDIAICLDLILCAKDVQLRTEDILALNDVISSKSYDSCTIHYHVKIIFQLISKIKVQLNSYELNYLIFTCLQILENTKNIESIENFQKVLYSIRIISNLCPEYPIVFGIMEENIKNSNIVFHEIFNRIFEWNNNYLSKEAFWLIRNLMSDEIHIFKDRIIKNLKIKRINAIF